MVKGGRSGWAGQDKCRLSHGLRLWLYGGAGRVYVDDEGCPMQWARGKLGGCVCSRGRTGVRDGSGDVSIARPLERQ